jgi:hypothetical protein
MAEISRRTGVSGLTDAELELLDQAVWRWGSRASYRTEFFLGQYNRPCHGLDDAALSSVLDRFEELGWTTGRNYSSPWSDTDRSVELTTVGGRLWEAERLPDWTRYVMDSGGAWVCTTPTRHRASIYGYSPIIVREFFDVGRVCGFFGVAADPIRTAAAIRPWIYWRPPQAVYLLSSWIESWDSEVDWERMETLRTWWRYPDEIGKLWGLPHARTE